MSLTVALAVSSLSLGILFSNHEDSAAGNSASGRPGHQPGGRAVYRGPGDQESCFKGVYGMPPYTYLRAYRMERAAEMLRQGELSVSDIAATVGYGSPSKFTAAFKVLMGVTPSAYRRAEMKANKDFRLCTNGGMRAPVREQGL